jgi:hypothetical protein
VTTQSASNDLGALNAKIHSVILDRGNRRLRNPRLRRQLVLAEFLKFSDYPNRLTYGDIDALPSFPEVFSRHSLSPIVVRRDIDHVNPNLLGQYLIDDPVLTT